MKKTGWLLMTFVSIAFAILTCTKISWMVPTEYWLSLLLIFIVFSYISFENFMDALLEQRKWKKSKTNNKIVCIKKYL